MTIEKEKNEQKKEVNIKPVKKVLTPISEAKAASKVLPALEKDAKEIADSIQKFKDTSIGCIP